MATLMLFITLCSVVAGVCGFAPGLGVPLALLVFIPFVRTALLVRARALRGRATSWQDRVGLALVSAVMTVVMTIVLVVVGCASLVAACFVAMGVEEASGLTGPGITLFFVLMAVVIGGLAWGIGQWVRLRWRRDLDSK